MAVAVAGNRVRSPPHDVFNSCCRSGNRGAFPLRARSLPDCRPAAAATITREEEEEEEEQEEDGPRRYPPHWRHLGGRRGWCRVRD